MNDAKTKTDSERKKRIDYDTLAKQVAYLTDKDKEKDERIKKLERHIADTGKLVIIPFPEEDRYDKCKEYKSLKTSFEKEEDNKMVEFSQLKNGYIGAPLENIEAKKNNIVLAIEDNSNETNFLKTIDELAQICKNYNTLEISETIENSPDFVQNRIGQYTTRRLYEKFVPWYIKFLHSMKNRID